ncbi:MAG: hypothetical protein HRT43_03670 [Campylobacteraceae bacterium]|nr:hypothetical protein [Campylobacteraceae bacterium]
MLRVFKNFGIISFLPALLIYMFILVSPAFSIGKKSGICGSWNNYCNGGTKVKNYTPRRPAGPSAQELREQWEKQDLEDASYDAYDTGLEFFERGDWGTAIMHFNEALDYNPENYDAMDDRNIAKGKLRDAYALQKKNKAMEEARAALMHGKKATTIGNSKASQNIFDTAAKGAPSSTSVVDARGYKEILGKAVSVPKEHKNNPKIIKMQKKRKVLELKFKKLEKRLAAIKKKKPESKKEKGILQVQEVKIKTEMDIVKQNTQVVDVKMESFVISLTKKKASPKK